MTENITNREIVTTLKKCLRDYQKTYNRLYKEDYEARKMALKPGEPAPFDDGRLYVQEIRDRAHEELRKIQSVGYDVVERAKADTKNAMMEAPTAEAVAMLTALNIADNQITPDDLKMAFEHYGSNYTICKALNAIADRTDNKAFKHDHPLNAELAAVEDLRHIVNGITLKNAENGLTEPGRVSFIINDLEAKWGHFDDGESGATE